MSFRRAVAASVWATLGAVGIVVAPGSADVSAAAVSRAADWAGSARVGSTSYAAPDSATYVAPTGSDSNSGTKTSPVRTLNRALAVVPAGGTVVMRGGRYNEQAAVYKTVTIQSYPGEEVWIDGSTSVSGWVRDGAGWRHDNWTTRFDHSPTYTKGAPDSTKPYWQFVNKATAPMAAHPDQVWVDGNQLSQVGSLAELRPGRFYLNEATSRLYVGSDPSGRAVSASNLAQALNIRAPGVVLRGIGIRRFAPSVYHVGAITVEKPGVSFENVHISEMATTGVSVQSTGTQFRSVTIERSGMLGVNGRYADGLYMNKVLARYNNTESFNIAPVSGGVKLGSTRGVTVQDSSFTDNKGPGFWEDMSVYNSVFRGTNFVGNAGDGLFLEISARVVVGDSLFVNNKRDGIKVNNTSNVKIWNNTFVGNGRPLDLVQDFRRNTNRWDAAVDARIAWPDPEMPWKLESVSVSNNVVGLSTAAANCLLCVEDYSGTATAEAMKIRANGNVYNRASTSAPTWLAVWSRGAGNPYVFTNLAGLKNTTGQEARGREITGSSVIGATGELADSVKNDAAQIALPLPGDVAGLIGRAGGTTRLGAWTDSAPAGVTPPVAPAPAPAISTGQIGRDDFARTVAGGWGTANVGGAWAIPAGSSRLSVASGAGRMQLNPGDGFSARLDQISSSRTDLRVSIAADKQAGSVGHFVSAIGRNVNGVGDYRTKVRIAANGAVSVWLLRTVGGVETSFASATPAGLTYTPGEKLNLRLQVAGTGTTSLKVKAWESTSQEPTAWTLTAADGSSGLQRPGSVAVYGYTAGSSTSGSVVVSYSQLQVSTV